jgi:ribonucleoside-diphosphate reductase alpha chain
MEKNDLEFRVENGIVTGLANPERLPGYVLNDDFDKRLSRNALSVMAKKYLKRDRGGNIIQGPRERIYDIARTMAEVERQYGRSDEEVDMFTRQFYEMISQQYFCPAGRIWSNAGTDIGGLFNCYVLPVPDSIDGIFESVKKQALIQKDGGGTGFNFSEIRPRGTYVVKSKGVASGVVSFIEQFDKATEIINSGNRRGANMGILDVDHPDILDFIYAKSRMGKLTNFNISIGVTDEFMEAVRRNSYYGLNFNGKPFTRDQLESINKNILGNIGGAEVGQRPRPPSLIISEDGKTVLDSYTNGEIGKIGEDNKVYLYAPKIMDMVARLAWETGDPGIIFLDTINRDNPLPGVGPIKATNPCGEQPLHPYDACNLGSINLERMVRIEDGKASVDYEKIRDVVHKAVRFMDNVNDANKGPIPEVEETVLNHRRIGLGIMGWHDMLVQLGIRYDSEEALDLGERVMRFISEEAKKASHELAKEKGVFPYWDKSVYAETGKEEDKVRNLQRTTIAPTGTISMLFDVASGIEPFFALAYKKNIRGGEEFHYFNRHLERIAKERGFWSEEFRKKVEETGSIQDLDEVPDNVKALFKGAHDIHYDWHVRTEAAFQRGTDNAISKTINMPESASVEDIKSVYLKAHELGLKGITIWRDNCRGTIQVLEKPSKKEKSLEEKLREVREKRPKVIGPTEKFETSYGSVFVTTNVISEGELEGTPYEVFIQHGKSGAVINSYTEALGRLISISLQHGVPVEEIVDQLRGIKADISFDNGRKILSVPDGVAQIMEEYFINRKKGEDEQKKNTQPGDPCYLSANCEGRLIRTEGCLKCNVCGESVC